jgi:hypothetical protein
MLLLNLLKAFGLDIPARLAELKARVLKMPPASRRDRKFGSASEVLALHRRRRPDGH